MTCCDSVSAGLSSPGKSFSYPSKYKFRRFAGRESFQQKLWYTLRKTSLFFPHVENSVENVQKSSFRAFFGCGIPHFPQGFPLLGSTSLPRLRTICKVQVGNLTVFRFWIRPLLQDPLISFWRMWISVEKQSLLHFPVLREVVALFLDYCCFFCFIAVLLSAGISAFIRLLCLLQRKSACLDWF